MERSFVIPETVWDGPPTSADVVVWLPAFGDSAYHTAMPYIPELRAQGWSVLLVEHNQDGFDMEQEVQTVLGALQTARRNRGQRRVLFVAASFGMQIAAEILRTDDLWRLRQLGLVSVVSVCGVSSGKDTRKPVGLFKHFAPSFVGSIIKAGQARDIKRATIEAGTKSPFDSGLEAAIEAHDQFRMEHFTGRALVQQLRAMASTPPLERNEFADIPALVLTTAGDDVVLKPSAYEGVGQAFGNCQWDLVPKSIHADLVELPSEYGKRICGFAQQMISAPLST